MAKAGGSLGRGRRTSERTPPLPTAEGLLESERVLQQELCRLVERVGGRWGLRGAPVPIGDVRLLANGVEEWVKRHETRLHGRRYFAGRPGLWHFLDDLYPLQDPNRWDTLRLAITDELLQRGWERVGGSRGSAWYLPE